MATSPGVMVLLLLLLFLASAPEADMSSWSRKRLYLPRLPGVEMPASKNNVMTGYHSCLPGTCQ